MKTLLFALALVALAYAHEHHHKFGDRLENFESRRAERHEKWNAMTEEDRQNFKNDHFKDIPAPVLEKLREIRGSHSREERQKFHEDMREKFISQISDEDKQKFQEKFEAIRERISSLPEEERKQEIQRIRDEHHQKFQHFGPPKNIPGRMHELPNQERIEKIEKFRQNMKEKFESLSPEDRQALLDKKHHHRFQENDDMPNRPHHFHFSEEHKQNLQEKLAKLTPEQIDEIRKQIGTRPMHP